MVCIFFFFIEKNKNRFVFISSLKWILKNPEILILDRNGFKGSESGFDTNKTNPLLSISIHFHLLGALNVRIELFLAVFR